MPGANVLKNFDPLWQLGPREACLPSILTCSSYRGLWIGHCCGLTLGHSALAAVSFYPNVGARQVMVLGVMIGGGFFLPYRWFAIGAGFGRIPWKPANQIDFGFHRFGYSFPPFVAFRFPRLTFPRDIRNVRWPRYSPPLP